MAFDKSLIYNNFSYSDFIEVLNSKKSIEVCRKIITENYVSYFKSNSEYYTTLANVAFDALHNIKNENDLDECVYYLNKFIFQTRNGKSKFQKSYSKYKKEKAFIDSNLTEPIIIGNKILDYGSGKGHLSNELGKKGFEVTGVDAIDFNSIDEEELKYQFQDKNSFSNNFNKFDTVIIKNVLHHMLDFDIERTINYLSKISNRIIVFEDIFNIRKEDLEKFIFSSKLSREISRLDELEIQNCIKIIDFYGNILAQGICEMSMPFNFKKVDDWKKIFKKYEFLIKTDKSIGFLDHHIHGFFQHLMIFEKK